MRIRLKFLDTGLPDDFSVDIDFPVLPLVGQGMNTTSLLCDGVMEGDVRKATSGLWKVDNIVWIKSDDLVMPEVYIKWFCETK